jgi:hypothetical protein
MIGIFRSAQNCLRKSLVAMRSLRKLVAVLLLFISGTGSAGTIAFSSANYSTNEITTPAILTLSRAGIATSSASVVVTTSNGSATAGNDYTAVSLTVSWAAGDATDKTVSVPILDDRLAEGSETVTVTLSAPIGDTLGAVVTATLTIIDFEQGTLQFGAANYEVSEVAGTVSIPVVRSVGSNGAVSIAYTTANGTATAPEFYTTTTGVLTLADGVSSMNIVVPIINNNVGQVDKDFRVTLSTVTGGALLGALLATTVTILNDDSDFTPGLTKIVPARPGVTQPAVLNLTQPSPFVATNTLLATINRIPELAIPSLTAVQAPSGTTTVTVGDNVYNFLPYAAMRVAEGVRQGIFLNSDMSGHIITDERLMINFQPAVAAIDVLQSFLTAAQMPKLTITEQGNITVQLMQGTPPLDLDSTGKLVILNYYFDRYLLRPSIVTMPAPAGRAVGAYVLPHPVGHPALRGAAVLQLVFDAGNQRRQQILATAPLIASELVTGLLSISGVSDVRFGASGIITFRFNGRVVTIYPDLLLRRVDTASYSSGNPPRGLQNTMDVNGDGATDFRMFYSTGDQQDFWVLP